MIVTIANPLVLLAATDRSPADQAVTARFGHDLLLANQECFRQGFHIRSPSPMLKKFWQHLSRDQKEIRAKGLTDDEELGKIRIDA